MADKEGAIPKDAPQDQQKDINDPLARFSRDEAMAAVTARRRETVKHDIAPDQVEAPEASTDANLDAETQVQAQQNEPTLLSDEDLTRYLVKTKVLGEERVVPLSELRATAQKTEAAEKYLADAKRLHAEAKAKAEAAAPPPTDEVTPSPAATEPTSTEPTDRAREFVAKLFAGDENEAARLLDQAIRSGRIPDATPSAPPIEQLVRTVEQNIVVRSALRQFANDYSGIVDDPKARQVADEFLMEITEGRPLEAFPPEQIPKLLNEAGKRTQEWFVARAGVKATVTTATTRDERAAKKQMIDELPRTDARATTQAPQPKTASDVIAAMRDKRGQSFRDPTQT